jgi:hypothetical protein
VVDLGSLGVLVACQPRLGIAASAFYLSLSCCSTVNLSVSILSFHSSPPTASRLITSIFHVLFSYAQIVRLIIWLASPPTPGHGQSFTPTFMPVFVTVHEPNFQVEKRKNSSCTMKMFSCKKNVNCNWCSENVHGPSVQTTSLPMIGKYLNCRVEKHVHDHKETLSQRS